MFSEEQKFDHHRPLQVRANSERDIFMQDTDPNKQIDLARERLQRDIRPYVMTDKWDHLGQECDCSEYFNPYLQW